VGGVVPNTGPSVQTLVVDVILIVLNRPVRVLNTARESLCIGTSLDSLMVSIEDRVGAGLGFLLLDLGLRLEKHLKAGLQLVRLERAVALSTVV